ncbi:hypothetical protein IE53DRAFT_369037 [Violaceomyces palustris]|uniref:Uncharacterized protein n=1 Tax=Violaceomyces palustris TaxID=1673888 RepID=A0ACD0NWT6_9BASI|nr:hypothetical protein IE53DRAFT_369037 [Violaceomyces palustris]
MAPSTTTVSPRKTRATTRSSLSNKNNHSPVKNAAKRRKSSETPLNKPGEEEGVVKEDEEDSKPTRVVLEDLEEKEWKGVVCEAREIIHGLTFSNQIPQLNEQDDPSSLQEQLTLHRIKASFMSRSDYKPTRSESGRRRSSLIEQLVNLEDDDDISIDWNLYKDWPEGMEEEENALLMYFRKLKFVYLEQETKLQFLKEVQDDPETGREAIVYSAAEVQEKEQSSRALKAQLVAAKSKVRALRAEVDQLSDLLFEPWTDLERDSKEAEKLLKEIGDMEIEMAKIRATTAGGGRGNMTTEEAEEVCDAQIQEMQALEDQTSKANRSIEKGKKELVASLKALDRLNAERSTAEKYAAEAKMGMGKDGGRDLETERLCASHQATLSLFKSMLGISSIASTEENELRIAYSIPPNPRNPRLNQNKRRRSSRGAGSADDRLRSDLGEATLVMNFEEIGGRIKKVQLLDEKGQEIDLSVAPSSRIEACRVANDVPMMIQEIIGCI